MLCNGLAEKRNTDPQGTKIPQGTKMTDNDGEIGTATEAIRGMYLARLMRQTGDIEAAQRWQAKIDRWLRRHSAAWRCRITPTSASPVGPATDCRPS